MDQENMKKIKTGKKNLVFVLNSLVHVYPEHFKFWLWYLRKNLSEQKRYGEGKEGWPRT